MQLGLSLGLEKTLFLVKTCYVPSELLALLKINSYSRQVSTLQFYWIQLLLFDLDMIRLTISFPIFYNTCFGKHTSNGERLVSLWCLFLLCGT